MTATRGRIVVALNEAAGKGHRDSNVDRLRAIFRASGAEAEVLPAGDPRAVTLRAVEEGAEVVVAAGGDGTMNAVASVLVDTPVSLGVMPFGTLNHFAKDMGIPLDPDQAVRTILEGQAVRVDVGEVNGRIFLNNSSIGLYADLVRRREKHRRLGQNKWLAMLWATNAALRSHSFLDVRLLSGEQEKQRRVPFVFVGNNEYKMEGFEIGSRESLDRGVLSLYLTQRHGRRRLLALALRALFGRLTQARDFEAHLVAALTVKTHHKSILVATDGEVTAMSTPLDYRLRPRALSMIVPPSAA